MKTDGQDRRAGTVRREILRPERPRAEDPAVIVPYDEAPSRRGRVLRPDPEPCRSPHAPRCWG